MPGSLRLVFFGSPDFAGPTLEALVASGHEVTQAVCQPDRPAGRGRKETPPPTKCLAESLCVPVCQPTALRSDAFLFWLKDQAPDLLVVVAYGRILPKPVLEAAPLGALNLHPSLLPRWRGPAPINWAILGGDSETGVTTMLLDEGQDTGPLLLSRSIPIAPTDTAGMLHDRLAAMGASLVVESVDGLAAGSLVPRPQDDSAATSGRLLEKADGLVDWRKPAEELSRQARGLDPWPGAFTSYRGRGLKLFGATTGPGIGAPGEILGIEDGRLHVATGRGSLVIPELQIEGKRRQPAGDFWRGQRLTPGDIIGG